MINNINFSGHVYITGSCNLKLTAEDFKKFKKFANDNNCDVYVVKDGIVTVPDDDIKLQFNFSKIFNLFKKKDK